MVLTRAMAKRNKQMSNKTQKEQVKHCDIKLEENNEIQQSNYETFENDVEKTPNDVKLKNYNDLVTEMRMRLCDIKNEEIRVRKIFKLVKLYERLSEEDAKEMMIYNENIRIPIKQYFIDNYEAYPRFQYKFEKFKADYM